MLNLPIITLLKSLHVNRIKNTRVPALKELERYSTSVILIQVRTVTFFFSLGFQVSTDLLPFLSTHLVMGWTMVGGEG